MEGKIEKIIENISQTSKIVMDKEYEKLEESFSNLRLLAKSSFVNQNEIDKLSLRFNTELSKIKKTMEIFGLDYEFNNLKVVISKYINSYKL